MNAVKARFVVTGVAIYLAVAGALACATAPPNLSPEGQAAFQKTRVIKALDLVRDTAIDANAAGVMPEADTRYVVTWHKTALLAMNETNWKAAVTKALDEAPNGLPQKSKDRLLPYLSLAKTLLQEIP